MHTISFKIILITTLVLVTTLLSSGLGMGLLFSREYTRALESRAVAIGQSLSSQLIRLLNLDIPLENLTGFENQCKAIVDQYEGIAYAMVVGPDGQTLFHSDPFRQGERATEQAELRAGGIEGKEQVWQVGPYLEAVIPIYIGTVDYQGSVHIGFAEAIISAKLKNLLIPWSIICIVVTICSALILFFLLQAQVSRPLNGLIALMQRIRREGISEKASPISSRSDEIGKLSRVFDELMQEVSQARTEIERHAGHLEEVVSRRTRELQETNLVLREKVAEREEAEKRYRELFEQAPVMYVIAHDSPGGPVVSNCNGLFVETLNYTLDRIIDHKLTQFLAPESRKPILQEFAGQTIMGRFRSVECQLRTRDGRIVETLVQAVPQTDTSGRRVGMRCMFVDITDRKLAEAEKRELLLKLQRMEKLEAIGLLAGGVAHDLNNILSGVVSYPELLLLQLPDDSALRKPLLTIQNAGRKAAEIVEDLLTLARRGVSTRTVLNINEIISDYLSSPEYAKLFSLHQNISVETGLEPELSNITGSPIHIRKAIMNLVSNAAEAQPDGGRIIISTSHRSLDVPQRRQEHFHEGDYVALKVEDQGCGIAREDMDRIFEPFYTKKVMGRSGTGLGMAVVWGTVQDHNGFIDIDSRPGEGTTVSLYFPVTEKRLEEKKDAPPVSAYTGEGETVLVVDDVEEQREIAAGILKTLNYRPIAVSSGAEALSFLQTRSVDLVLLDMIMDREMDGLETYRRILAISPGQKAIIASGFAETDRVKRVRQLGAGQYIRKPYNLETIGLAIRKELQRR